MEKNIIKQEIMLLDQDLNEHTAQFQRTNLLLKLGFALTFLLYCVFNQSLYLGDPTTWVHYFDNTQAIVGFAVITVIAVLMALFLAWVKHAAYIHFGLYGSIGAIVFTVIAFALFAELFSSSANQDAKANIQIEHSSTYKSTLQYGAVGGAINAALTEQIASASKRLAQCNYRMTQGKEKHCDGDKAKLAALEAQSSAALQAQIAANNAGQQLNYARQDKLKADSYNPVIVMMARAWAAVAGGEYSDHIKAATVIVMMIVSAAFETLHHFLSGARAAAKNKIWTLRRKIAELASRVQPDLNLAEPDLTVGQVSPNLTYPDLNLAEPIRKKATYPLHFGSTVPYSAFAPMTGGGIGSKLAETLANELSTAQYARNHIHSKINTMLNNPTAAPNRPTRPSEGNLTGQVAENGGQVGQVKIEPNLASEYEQNLAKAKRDAEEAARQAEIERLAREAAEQAKREAEEAARQAEIERLAELDGLTDDQVFIAARAIHTAIMAGEVTMLGFNSLKDVVKNAGLPRANDRIRILIKLALRELAKNGQGGVVANPNTGIGKPDYIIANLT